MITKTRKARGLSQAALAQILGVTQGFVGHLETGRNRPTDEMLQRLAKVLKVDADILALSMGIVRPWMLECCSKDPENLLRALKRIRRK